MFLSQGGLIPDWTTGKVSTFSSWLLPIHLPILSLATQTDRHTHTHTHPPVWAMLEYLLSAQQAWMYIHFHVRAYARVSFTRGIHLPSPELGHIPISSWLNRYVLSWWGFSKLPGKMRHPCLPGPCLPLLDVPTATCLFSNDNYPDHKSNQGVLSPYHVLRQYSKHVF